MLRRLIAAALAVVAAPVAAWACSGMTAYSPEELVREADLVVRARATGYARQSGPPRLGEPSIVQFAVLEVLRGGTEAPVGLQISGTLSEVDDFNDRPAPYTFVRRQGRSGSCFARTYRDGGEFLLFLKKDEAGAWTPYWASLAPVNEQVRPGTDPWVAAIREIAARERR